MNADGTDVVQLTHNDALDWGGFWSPDGTRIAFMSDRDGDREIFVTNADGTGVVQLTHNDALDWAPLWSPDGTRIVFSSDRDGDFEIFVMNADGSDPLPLTDNDYQEWTASWSPDGTQIAFDSDRDGDFEIFVMNADGTGVVQLTHDDALDWFPLWSPDGTRIVFESDPDDSLHMGSAFHSTPDVVIMNADGTGVRRLTHPADDSGGSWSPDGTRIAFTSDRDGDREIFIIDAEAVQAELGPVVSDSTSVFVEGTGYTTESVTLDAGLWTAASHSHGDGSGQFIVRLVGSPDSSRPLCWNQGRGVVLADSQSDAVSVYSSLPVVVADTDDAWCSTGEFTLEVTASGRWLVVLTNESPLSGDGSEDDGSEDDGSEDDGSEDDGSEDDGFEDDGFDGLTVGGIALEPRVRHPREGVEPTDLVFDQISVGDRYACGVTDEGGIACWGYDNTWGQASPPLGEFVQVAAGDNHTCALTVAGEVQCWGDGYYGQTAAPEGTFVQVTAEDLSVGDRYACGVTDDCQRTGGIECWGYDNTWGRGEPAAGRVRAGGRGRQPHLRADRGRRGAVLGGRLLRADGRARRHLRAGHRRGPHVVCFEIRGQLHVLGRPLRRQGVAAWVEHRATVRGRLVRAASRRHPRMQPLDVQ